MVVAESLRWLSVTVNSPSLLGSAALSSLAVILTSPASSSDIVTLAAFSIPIDTSVSPDVIESSVIVTLSLSSSNKSSRTMTSIVAVVWPARIVTEPLSVV